jgi:hypothetical protein
MTSKKLMKKILKLLTLRFHGFRIKSGMTITYLISFVAVLGVFLLFLFNPWNNNASAAWFNDAWGYRKAITITVASSASDITNLDTLLTIDTTGMTANLQTNCEDLRFTDVNGNILNYFNDSCTDNSSSNTVWVRVNTVPKNTTTYTLYMYYGNATAPAGSNSTLFSLYNGLEAYWAMNESSWNTTAGEIKDNSVNTANGVARGDATTTASGQFGRGALLDGSADSFTTADNANAELGASDFTLSTWVYMTAYPVTGFGAAIITKDDGAAAFAPYALVMRSTDNNVHSWMSTNGSSWDVMNDTNLGGASALTLNGWHHVAFIRESGSCKLYIDTVVTSETSSGISCSGTLVNTAAKPYFGGQFQSPNGNGIAGRMDDARIYTRALSATDLSSLYTNPGSISTNVNATIVPSTSFAAEEKATSPIAYYKFDEGQGTVAEDSSANNLDGTYTNAPPVIPEGQCISGKCISTDGSGDYVDLGTTDASNRTNLNITGAMTVSLWYKPNETTSSVLFSRATGNSGATEAFALGLTSSNFLNLFINSGSSSKTVTSTTTALQNGQWYHIEAVFIPSTSMTIYVNGKVDATSSTSVPTGSQTLTGAKTFIAGICSTGCASVSSIPKGMFDEVKIFPYAKSAAQVQADFNAKGNPDGIASVMGNNAQNNQALSDGLVGYWKMDEASWTNNCSTTSVLDSSGNAFKGATCPNSTGPTGGNLGKFGNAGNFDGSDDYVEIADNNTFDISYGSVSAWVNVEDSGANKNGTIIGNWNSTGGSVAGYALRYLFDDGIGGAQMEFRAYNAPLDSANEFRARTTTYYTPGWHHVVGTSDGTKIRIFVDGAERASTNFAATITASNLPMRIGKGQGSPANDNADASIDEARIYNRALSGAEVSQLYNWAPGPVGYWKLDDKTGTTGADASGYVNNGTLGSTTALPTWTNGKYGSSLSFDGGDTFFVSDSASLSITQGFSLSGWIKPTNVSGFKPIVTKEGGGQTGYFLYLNGANVYTGYGNSGFYSQTTSTSPITAGIWTHVASSWDGTTLRTYVNGVLLQSSTPGSSVADNSDNLGIGAAFDLSSTTTGAIDDVKVYNYARTAGQIIEDMNGGHPAPGSPVSSAVAHWKLDEGYGTTANDTTPNDNDLTLSTATSAWTNSGKFGKAFIGLGTNWISRADDADLDFVATDDGTFSLWFKSTSATNPGATEYLFSKGPGTPTVGYAVYATTSGTVCFGIDDDSTFGPDDSSCSTADIYDATWHHITAVKTGTSSIQLFVDSQPQTADSSISATGSLANAVSLYIGDFNGTDNGNEFNGTLDEIKVYRSALTADQVKLDMNKSQAQVLGSTGDNTNFAKSAESQKYCIPGDSATCTAPVGEWNLNEGTGTTANDSSGNANTGTITAGTGGWVNGKSDGKAYNFDSANTMVDVGSGSNIDDIGPLTYEAWVYPRSIGESTGRIFSKGTSEISLLMQASNAFAFTAAFSGGSVQRFAAINTLPYNTWSHVVATWDGTFTGSGIHLYVNGKEVTYQSTVNTTGTRVSDASTNQIIGNNSGQSRTFDGYIDQARIFNYVRTPAQIAYDYNQGKPIAHWKMDECQGTVINDSSGNSLTGTLTIGGTGSNTTAGTCTSSGAWFDGATGKRNYSMDFDNTDDSISFGNPALLDFSGEEPFSVSLWAKLASDDTGTVIGQYDTSNNASWEVMYNSAFDWFEFSVSLDGTTSDVTIACSPSGAAPFGSWYFITGVYDAANNVIKCNTNASTFVSRSDATTLFDSSANLLIGNRTGTANYYNGQIDDIKIYNYPLTATQVKTLYNEGAFRVGPVTGAP